MLKAISHILITLGAAYFIYKEAGLVTAIVVAYILVAFSFIEILFNSYRDKIKFFTQQDSEKTESIEELSKQINDHRKHVQNLRM